MPYKNHNSAAVFIEKNGHADARQENLIVEGHASISRWGYRQTMRQIDGPSDAIRKAPFQVDALPYGCPAIENRIAAQFAAQFGSCVFS